MWVPAAISIISMPRQLRIAIGLFDYSQPVMMARALALRVSAGARDGGCFYVTQGRSRPDDWSRRDVPSLPRADNCSPSGFTRGSSMTPGFGELRGVTWVEGE